MTRRMSTGEVVLLTGAGAVLMYLAYELFFASSSPTAQNPSDSIGAEVGASIVNNLNDALSAAANSVWNGTGTGALDSWSNFLNFLTGNCPDGNCSGAGT